MGLKDTIKGNIMASNNRCLLTTEKIGRIVNKANNKENSYTVSVISKDGTKDIIDNVSVKYDGSVSYISKEPEINEYVYVIEDQNRYIITGIYKEFQNKSISDDIFSNILNSGIGGFCQ